MDEYIKLFETHSDYEEYINSQDKILPNVSFCKDLEEVHYNEKPHDYSQDYLTFVALENGIISFNIEKSIGTNMITSISYSKDNGDTWATTNNVNNKAQNLVINVSVNEDDKVLWKGNATQLGYLDENNEEIVGSFFSSTCEFDAKGNVMSLLYGDNFKGKTIITKEYAFCYLFSDYNEVKICSIVNARNLSLPATTLTDFCYYSMFIGCTSLTEAPQLPATTLEYGCYNGMFLNCTSLTTAPELPATTLAEGCYNEMFNGCTSLATAPELPATTLADSCYRYMFSSCTSLTAAPELPATTLEYGCYNGMFNSCTNLNYIKAMFTTTPSSTYTGNWVYGVSATGTFVKNSAAQWNVSGVNGIPNGWTVETANN